MINALIERSKKLDLFYIHSLIVLVLTNMGSVLNLVFHVAMGHWLTKGEYGTMSSLLGVFLIFSTPFMSLQNTMAHFTSHFLADGHPDAIYRIVAVWFRRLLILFSILLVAVFLGRNDLASTLHLNSATPLLLVALLVAMNGFGPLFIGVLQGKQCFVHMCVAANIWALIRLILGGCIVYFWMATASSVLAAHLIGIICTVFLARYWMYHDAPANVREIAMNSEYDDRMSGNNQYFLLSITVLLTFSMLMNGDVIFVKAFFKNSNDFGTYSRASTIARTLIFLVQPIVGAFFPKVVTRGETTKAHIAMLFKCAALMFIMEGLALGGCILWPQLPLMILYGRDAADPQAILLVRAVAVAMAPVGLMQVFINYEMAQARFKILIPLVISFVGMILGYNLFHQTLLQSVVVLAICGYTALLWITLIVARPLFVKNH